MASMAEATIRLPAILATLAMRGSAPTRVERWPMTSSSGWMRSIALASPATAMLSFAAAAASGRPHTVAAT